MQRLARMGFQLARTALPVECLQSITEQHSPYSNTAAPTWLPRFKKSTSDDYLFVDAGSYFMVQVNDRVGNTLLYVKSSVAIARMCGLAVCADQWSYTTYRSIGRLQYEVSVSRKSGVSKAQLLRVARSLMPTGNY